MPSRPTNALDGMNRRQRTYLARPLDHGSPLFDAHDFSLPVVGLGYKALPGWHACMPRVSRSFLWEDEDVQVRERKKERKQKRSPTQEGDGMQGEGIVATDDGDVREGRKGESDVDHSGKGCCASGGGVTGRMVLVSLLLYPVRIMHLRPNLIDCEMMV